MEKDILVKLMFKAFPDLVERSYYIVIERYRDKIPNLGSEVESNDTLKSLVCLVMSKNIYFTFRNRVCKQERAFINEACIVYLSNNPSARLTAVEDFCLSRYQTANPFSV